MILYVNGDSNTAAAEAVNPHGFAEDDSMYWAMGRRPHPDNLRVSWGAELANHMGAILDCDAESASSNDRIIRTTRTYLKTNRPDYIVIGWSTWEREEWISSDRYWQVSVGGMGEDWPLDIRHRYKEYIANLDYERKMQEQAAKIWQLGHEIGELEIPYLFFTCYEPFSHGPQYFWGDTYLEPYNRDFTYYNWSIAQGFKPVYPGSYHFGPDAHAAWAEFLYQKIVQKNLTR